eukprot:gnl/MRDRNA2_/MRDRNA2_173228_c0_seq1.p1 gnl/MRDRNA2_/MRDRNA2_173228_c0~~gnl/MRDRNA2_/MRDRNA2_173228_c0_seq1.p1  ORF type:complete len:529 (+),score=75.64 gnl/MRDRNA2_/MRDRNA2_173228_c0_seq1:108-1694(+)
MAHSPGQLQLRAWCILALLAGNEVTQIMAYKYRSTASKISSDSSIMDMRHSSATNRRQSAEIFGQGDHKIDKSSSHPTRQEIHNALANGKRQSVEIFEDDIIGRDATTPAIPTDHSDCRIGDINGSFWDRCIPAEYCYFREGWFDYEFYEWHPDKTCHLQPQFQNDTELLDRFVRASVYLIKKSRAFSNDPTTENLKAAMRAQEGLTQSTMGLSSEAKKSKTQLQAMIKRWEGHDNATIMNYCNYSKDHSILFFLCEHSELVDYQGNLLDTELEQQWLNGFDGPDIWDVSPREFTMHHMQAGFKAMNPDEDSHEDMIGLVKAIEEPNEAKLLQKMRNASGIANQTDFDDLMNESKASMEEALRECTHGEKVNFQCSSDNIFESVIGYDVSELDEIVEMSDNNVAAGAMSAMQNQSLAIQQRRRRPGVGYFVGMWAGMGTQMTAYAAFISAAAGGMAYGAAIGLGCTLTWGAVCVTSLLAGGYVLATAMFVKFRAWRKKKVKCLWCRREIQNGYRFECPYAHCSEYYGR